MEKSNRRMASAKSKKPSEFSTTQSASEKQKNYGDSASMQSEQPSTFLFAANGDKVTGEITHLPIISFPLSTKEKEDDYLAMKGTKIPQRPKKRAKKIDRLLQCCFPGVWLSKLTMRRYKVKEKKSVKKQKRRGLKGMEDLDSDSE